MIANERQYQITKSWVDKFTVTLSEMETLPNLDIHPMMKQAHIDALNSQLEELKSEVAEYEAHVEPPLSPDEDTP